MRVTSVRAQRTARRYPEGAVVEVRYDPDEPREAVPGLMAAMGRLKGSG